MKTLYKINRSKYAGFLVALVGVVFIFHCAATKGFAADLTMSVNGLPYTVAANLDSDPELEIIATVEGSGTIYAWDNDGSGYIRSDGVFNNIAASLGSSRSSPVVADIDKDGTLEVIVAFNSRDIGVFDAVTGSLEKDLQAETDVQFKSTPVVANLDGDSELEIIIGSWSTDEVYVCWDDCANRNAPPHTVGTLVKFADNLATFDASLAVGDLDNNGKNDVVGVNIAGNVYIWDNTGAVSSPLMMTEGGRQLLELPPGERMLALDVTPPHTYSSPALADLDFDGDLEIILGSDDGFVYAWHDDSTQVFDPIDVGSPVIASVAVGNLIDPAGRLKGKLEIVAATQDGQIYAWHDDGTQVAGFPVATGININSSPAIGDVDNDGEKEIIIGTDTDGGTIGHVYVYNNDGTQVYDLETGDHPVGFSSPALADLNNDTAVEVIVGVGDILGSGSQVRAWDIDIACDSESYCDTDRMDWPKFRRDLNGSGKYEKPLFKDDFEGSGLIGLPNWNNFDETVKENGKAISQKIPHLISDDGSGESTDGTEYRSDGIGLRMPFRKNANLIFKFDGFHFKDPDARRRPGYGVVVASGTQWHDSGDDIRKIVLGTSAVKESHDPGRFQIFIQKGKCSDSTCWEMFDIGEIGYKNDPPTESYEYSAIFRWIGEPTSGDLDDRRMEVYLYRTDEGIDYANDLVYVWPDPDGQFGDPLGVEGDWGSSDKKGWGAASGSWIAYGKSYLDSFSVYGPDGAVLDQGIPVLGGIPSDSETGRPVPIICSPDDVIQYNWESSFSARPEDDLYGNGPEDTLRGESALHQPRWLPGVVCPDPADYFCSECPNPDDNDNYYWGSYHFRVIYHSPAGNADVRRTTVYLTCGNGVCDADIGENYHICPDDDCTCGDGFCQPEGNPNEDFNICYEDCHCGNGICESEMGEVSDKLDPNYCEADCHCGNGVCDMGETYITCPGDNCTMPPKTLPQPIPIVDLGGRGKSGPRF